MSSKRNFIFYKITKKIVTNETFSLKRINFYHIDTTRNKKKNVYIIITEFSTEESESINAYRLNESDHSL